MGNPMPLAVVLFSIAALVGCGGRWTKPDEKAFAENDARCLELAMKTSPELPPPAEAHAVHESNRARQKAYADCMLVSGL
jgi:hypothetical protein